MTHILLATTGESPQVITETLYAVHQQNLRWPDELHLITTTLGRDRAILGLLLQGHLERLCIELGRTQPAFAPDHVHVVPAANGQEVDDARSLEDHEALANFIMQQVRDYTATRDNTVHASLAGGRKTMTFYLGYAMTLFGRAEDILTHVLVNDRCYESNGFWFPTDHPTHRWLVDRNGNPVLNRHGQPADASPLHAQITLANIPFIRHRHGMPPIFHRIETPLAFRKIVHLINLSENPAKLTLTLETAAHRIIVGSLDQGFAIEPVEVPLGKLELAFFAMLARATKEGYPITRPAGPSLDLLKRFLDELMPLCGLPRQVRPIDALDELEEWSERATQDRIERKTLDALRGERRRISQQRSPDRRAGKASLAMETTVLAYELGMRASWFDDRRTELRNSFEAVFPVALVDALLPTSRKGRQRSYEIPIAPENITLR